MAEKSPRRFHKGVMYFVIYKKINIANRKVSALVSHKSFKKHGNKEKVHPLSRMFFTKTAPAVASKPSLLSTSNPHDE